MVPGFFQFQLALNESFLEKYITSSGCILRSKSPVSHLSF